MTNYKIQAQAIRDKINESKKILLVAHNNPDADTIGSVCAWINYLQDRGKDVFAYCQDAVPSQLNYLAGSEHISQDENLWYESYDLIITNDSASLDKAGIDIHLQKLPKKTHLINIDHHITNPHYGDTNLVIDDASSTTEIVSRLLMHWDEPITETMAYPLLHGLVTDTDNFTNPATSYRSLEIAAELIHAGADLHKIILQAFNNKSLGDLKLWGIALSRLKRNKTFNIVTTYVTNQDLLDCETNEEAAEGISNYLTLISDTNIFLVLRPKDNGTIKGSLRTVSNTIDVSHIALLLGGGGHRKAAGFTMKGILKTTGDNWTIS